MKEADFDEVVDRLKTDAGLTNAEVVATGGGIDCIRIPCGKYVLYFGTATHSDLAVGMTNDGKRGIA